MTNGMYRVYATTSHSDRAQLLATFTFRIDADIWRECVAQRNRSWKVEVRDPAPARRNSIRFGTRAIRRGRISRRLR